MKSTFLQNTSVNQFKTPWKHFVIDNFLPNKEFKKVQKHLCSVVDGYQKRENDSFDLNFMFVPDLNLAKLFLSDEFKKFLEEIVQKKLEIYEEGLVQLRMMTPDSPAMPPHIDDQEDGRSLVCIYYLSPNWQSENGGELLLHQDSIKTQKNESKVIQPLENRMVLFFADDTNWHSVTKVKDWNRYSIISEWIVQEAR